MSGIDLGKVIDIAGIVNDAVKATAQQKTNNLAPKDAAKVASDVTPKVEKQLSEEVNAVITNATNAEPWYQSRVVLGSIVSATAMLANILGYQFDLIDQETLVNIVLQGATLAGTAYALYGRLIARFKKPVGE